MTAEIADRKKLLREQAHANRNAQADKDPLSQVICDTFMALPDYAAAKTVLFYIDVRAEGARRGTRCPRPSLRAKPSLCRGATAGKLELSALPT